MEQALIIGSVIIFVVGLIVGLIWFTKYMEKKRAEAMRTLSMELGVEYQAEVPDLQGELSDYHVFGLGHSKKLRNVLIGSEGSTEYQLFDYKYTVGHGRHQVTYDQCMIYIRTGKPLPSFTLAPENIFHKIGSKFGYQDIDFDSHPTFSKKYLLRGPEEAEIRSAFHPGVLDHFQQNLGQYVEGNGNGLLVYGQGKRLKKVEQLRDLIALGAQTKEAFG